jgi:Spy/CpxP family protein refolding chaperone
MKTLLRVTVAAGVLAASGLALTPLLAQDTTPQGAAPRRMGPGGPGGFGFGRGPGGPFGMLGELGRGLRQLELTDSQREQLRGVMQSHQTEFREIGDRLRTAHEALNTAVAAETSDETTIRARSADVAAIQADAAVLRARVHQEVFSLLTAEQQAKAKELKAQGEARMKERASRRRERRDRVPQQG